MTRIAQMRSPRYMEGSQRLLDLVVTIEEDQIAEYEARHCLECGEPQFTTPEGIVCPQGHVNVGTILA